MMFGRTFAACSGEQNEMFGDLFFTDARAARSRSRNPKDQNPNTSLGLDHRTDVSRRANFSTGRCGQVRSGAAR